MLQQIRYFLLKLLKGAPEEKEVKIQKIGKLHFTSHPLHISFKKYLKKLD